MHQILKRLELIKTAISIEDEEIIDLQVFKLNTMECDEDVQNILTKIEEKNYGSVVGDIETYIQYFSGLVRYEDKELQGLKLELKVLEKQLQELSEEKNEYINDINEFNILSHLRIGDVIQKIHKIKKNTLEAMIQKKKEVFDSLKEEYLETKEQYQNLKEEKEEKERELDDSNPFDDSYDEIA